MGKTQGRRVGTYTVRFAQKTTVRMARRPVTVSSVQALDGASFRSPVAPGSIATVFQANLVPTGGISMVFNDTISAPIFATTQNQANIQIPWELQGQTSATLKATNPDGTAITFDVALAPYAPAIFSTNERGSGQGIVTVSGTGKLAAVAGSVEGKDTEAASRGDFISIYCVGLGPVNNPPATGVAASDTTSTSLSPVTVTFNGSTSVPATFAGLAPGQVGVFQVNVRIPEDVPSGNAVTLAIRAGGVVSNTVALSIQ